MLVPLRWLSTYVDFPWTPKELADRLTMSGSKVESIRTFPGHLAGVVTGRVVRLHPHPAADRLSVCAIDVGDRQITVLTGAPNAAEGTIVPVALPGAVLPGQAQPVQAVAIRGIVSEGMACSEKELGLGDDASGLWVLPPDTPVGRPLAELVQLERHVLELEIYPNRPDCLSVLGVAREVAALAGSPLRPPADTVQESGPPVASLASLEVREPTLCPRYVARVIEGVRVGPSPLWLQHRLRAAGMRPINNVVDVTNYVMLETGQPLHAFDYDKLAGHRIVVRRARKGEQLVTLDGVERNLDEETLVIADAERPLVVAGIMGGVEAEVDENTRNILLESAYFDPVSIRRTARRLGMGTESSYRFERGTDPGAPARVADRAAQLIVELAGGRVARGRLEVRNRDAFRAVEITLRARRLNNLLGTQISPAEIKRLLRHLGFEVELEGDGVLSVRVPTFRRDVEREADLVEEVARLHGYDRIPATLPSGASRPGGRVPPLELTSRVRQSLLGLGLSEAVTYTFVGPKVWDALRLPAESPLRHCVPIRNPLSEEQSLLRTTLVPGLLEVARRNAARRNRAVHLFEVGTTFWPARLPITELPEERHTLGLFMMGTWPEPTWDRRPRAADFFDLKGVVEELLAALGLDATVRSEADRPYLHPGRAAQLYARDQALGYLGEVHPDVAESFDLPERAYVAEIDLDRLLPLVQHEIRYQPISRHPVVERDLALIVPREVPAATVEATLAQAGGNLLRSIRLFDVYQGEPVPDGFRSLAYSLRFQAPDRTLTDEEVNALVQAMADAAASLGATLRR